jgi:protein SCO1/2
VKPLRARISTAAILAVIVLFGGCRGAEKTSSATQQQTGVKKYHIRGIVVSSDAKTGAVTVDTDAIPGYMDAMTMPFTLAQPNIASELHPGDTITATLTVTANADVLGEIVVIAQAKPDYKPAVTYNDLEPGETVPDFHFLNQSGRMVRVGQWHGKVVLLTFIYTRCPLPNFCVRMSRNFAEMDKALEKDPKLYAKTHLCCAAMAARIRGIIRRRRSRTGTLRRRPCRICPRCCSFSMWAPRRRGTERSPIPFRRW